MKVTQGDKSSCPNQIIVFDKKLKSGKNQAINDLISKFKSDDKLEFFELRSVEGQIYMIRGGLDQEKLRVHGSKVRSQLDPKAELISCQGSENDLYAVLEGFVLSSYQFVHYFKNSEEKRYALQAILVDESFDQKRIEELFNINEMVSWTRDMVNEPVSFLNATQLAKEIEHLGERTGFKTSVLEKTQIESLKMGGLLAVNKGSIDPPTFTIAEYKPKKAKNKKPIVLVGKGVVYDTGGLSLKPTPNSMDVMKSDMAGAACVAGALGMIALEKLPYWVIALIPATDNRPGLNAYAPGDIITMYDGTTVEVLNTDAEGRMILADALAYSDKFKPELVISAATLTGAAHRAIGEHAAISMGNAEDKIFRKLEDAGIQTHERVVRFPFWDEYFEEMKSSIADLKNIGGPSAGMITAGKFLEHFVKAPYIHLDIAGPAWLDKNSAYRTKGGSGYGVRLFYQFVKGLSHE
ncbi:MAG: leucyl aminopeptidase [Bacteroidetes bacterium]|nr:MAG: leucyl aminopeptidase [Bacteroidota bacterium]